MIRLLVLVTAMATASAAFGYEYPYTNPYEATVLGTPKALKAQLPGSKRLPLKNYTLTVFPDRKVPEVLWYDSELRFSLIEQKGPAPMVIAISGTGGGANSGKMNVLQRALYGAGFHVLSLPSPTHSNFITAASTSQVPGNPVLDASDLYRVMEMALERVQGRVEIDGFHLVGYSLGALQAAYVTRVDDERKRFNFRRVLMINPPLNLFDSVNKLDGFIEQSGLLEPAAGLRFRNDLFKSLSKVYRGGDFVSFTGQDFLFAAYQETQPSDEKLAALIGMAFRISSGNMVFTSDVLTRHNYIVPENVELTSTTSLTEYSKVAMRTSFVDYFRDVYAPYFMRTVTGRTAEQLIEQASLRSIEDYLRGNERIGMLHNADDIIMLPGEVDYLAGLLGDRATVYPHGGHCGNMDHKDNVAAMVSWFRGR